MTDASTHAGLVTLRAGTAEDIPGLRALGEAVVPPTYGPIDAAYAQRMLDEWWKPEVFATSLTRNAHVVAERDGEVVDGNEQAFGFYQAHGFEEVERVSDGGPFPDDVWLCKQLEKDLLR